MKIWVYQSRNGYIRLFNGDRLGFMTARKEQDDDNRLSLEQIIEQEGLDYGGSYDEGHFWIDDGGHIELTEVEE